MSTPDQNPIGIAVCVSYVTQASYKESRDTYDVEKNKFYVSFVVQNEHTTTRICSALRYHSHRAA